MDCIVCCESVEYITKYGCEHTVCYKCGTKLIFLYSDNKCPLCKKECKKPTFASIQVKQDDDNIGSDSKYNTSEIKNIGSDSKYNTSEIKNNEKSKPKISEKFDISTKLETISISKSSDLNKQTTEDNHAFYESKQIYKTVKSLLDIKCKECNKILNSKKELINHYKTTHAKLLCNVCVNNGHQFWYELVSYTFESLNLHKKGLLSESGFTGHVFCSLCNIYFYGKEEARIHCNSEHQLCTVCEVLGIKLKFYRNFAELEMHYKSQHYCCTSSVCIKNLCYVYAHKSELWSHCVSQHGMNIQISDINIRECTPNPQCCSLGGKEDGMNDLYRQNAPIISPLINEPHFPKFSSKNTTGEAVPSFLNRENITRNSLEVESRIGQIKSITNIFCKEISEGIGKYIDGVKSLNDLVKEIEESVGNSVCLRILENVSFLQKQKEIKAFLEEYRKSVLFPKFKKNENAVKAAAPPSKKNEPLGFKIIDFSKKKSS